MQNETPPRQYSEWRTNPSDRGEDAAYAFGYDLIRYCRDAALTGTRSSPSPEVFSHVEQAVDTALHNVVDLLEGFFRTQSGPGHTLEYALHVVVKDLEGNPVESQIISPCKHDLPIGYWKWARDREFR